MGALFVMVRCSLNYEFTYYFVFKFKMTISKIPNPHSFPSDRLNHCESLKLSIRFWEKFDNLLNAKIFLPALKKVFDKSINPEIKIHD